MIITATPSPEEVIEQFPGGAAPACPGKILLQQHDRQQAMAHGHAAGLGGHDANPVGTPRLRQRIVFAPETVVLAADIRHWRPVDRAADRAGVPAPRPGRLIEHRQGKTLQQSRQSPHGRIRR